MKDKIEDTIAQSNYLVIFAFIAIIGSCLAFVVIDYFDERELYSMLSLFYTFSSQVAQAQYNEVQSFLYNIIVKL
jgi:hypothetical protein